MPHEVTMPQLGMAQDAGKIVAWHKSPGDAVAEGDVLFEVETDKATMEVEAPSAGFLTDVAAAAGDDVPVGRVIALISDSPEDTGATAPTGDAAAAAGGADAADAAADLPAGHEVIMPTLGMAQDSGLLVSWQKEAGDAVAADDVLFEVETDKSTMEVAAGADGFVAALLAEAGEAVPTGRTIAIISAEAPAAPVRRALAESAGGAPVDAPAPASSPASAPPAPASSAPAPAPAMAPAAGGRILASPKARRLALEQGLDLARLERAGHPQPYHVKDLEVLKSLPPETAAAAAGATADAPRRLTAEVAQDGFADFTAWAADHAGLDDPQALLAGLAAASLGRPAVVTVDGPGRSRSYAAQRRLGAVTPSDAAAELLIRDLRLSAIAEVQLGAEATPVLTLSRRGAGLTLTLECAPEHLSADDAVSLLSTFAGRMEQPLRHLL